MKRHWRWMLLLCLILMIPAQASANSPPPAPEYDCSLQIVNAPTEDFCVMLLTREPGATREALLNGVRADHVNMVQALFSLETEGWYPVSEVPEDGLVHFSGDPLIEWFYIDQDWKEYRIMLTTESGTIQATDPIVRRDFTNKASFDVSTNQVTQSIDYGEYIKRILIAVGVTLFVELILLKMLGLMNQRNLRIVIVTNLCTQAFLNGMLFVLHYFEYSRWDWSLLFILEAGIFAIESIVYAIHLESKSAGYSVRYALVANLCSLIVGLLVYGVTISPFFIIPIGMLIGLGILSGIVYGCTVKRSHPTKQDSDQRLQDQ